ncbi:MAG: HAD-IA family hydrolase [Acidobacteriaceae bacterium]|nr:HAD-IA family hydrolase [Acidobacteriaceae bacterium]
MNVVFNGTTLAKPLAMIFDLDGVLIHSMPMHVVAWEHYLDHLGVQVENLEARMHGKRNSELVRDFLGNAASEEAVLEHGRAKERLFRELLLKEDLTRFQVPGVRQFLERYKNVPKAIGSNAEPENINFVLDRFNLRPYFSVIVNGLEVERPKPFPDIYLKAAQHLQVKPEHCIVFEDSPTGVEAGIAAGMRVVGVETTPTEFVGVALRIKDFNDPALQRWIQSELACYNPH